MKRRGTNPLGVPVVGDRYDHAIGGVYDVDWVCACGDYDDGETCVGLRGDAMTWTGAVSQLRDAGFRKHNARSHFPSESEVK